MKKLLCLLFAFAISGCSGSMAAKETCDCIDEGMVLPGTNTAVVRILLDSNGVPKVSAEKVVIEVGQRIVWVGPGKMEIKFPEGSPFKERVLKTDNGVINRVAPTQRFKGSEKSFKYDVVVNGKVLDPFIIIRKRQ